nr:hypothetical protein SUGSMm_34970 [Morganella morganii subsp. sibonii]
MTGRIAAVAPSATVYYNQHRGSFPDGEKVSAGGRQKKSTAIGGAFKKSLWTDRVNVQEVKKTVA